jgi:tRNA threonylcarbamoyladenosine biosynthesis protein TsaE
MIKVIDLPDEHTSEKIAARLAACVVSPLVLTFRGEIGAGKTTLIRALLRCLGVTGAIKSPTFSLIESYQTRHLQIHHFDLYRVHDASELDYIGFRDYFSDETVCCVEWPERAGHGLEHVDVEFSLDFKGNGREMHARACSLAGISLLSCFCGGS